jgi:Raf kinase inhibitor-like YbhB/YbcL family protein
MGGATHNSAMAFTLESKSFSHEQPIPERHTCVGADVSPELHWSGVPSGTMSFLLIVDDPDAPDPKAPRGRPFVHWLVYNLPAAQRSLAEGGVLPEGARHGKNEFGAVGWNGPCPPRGRHRYYFRLHALDVALRELGAPEHDELEDVIDGHVLGTATLMGTFEKKHHR